MKTVSILVSFALTLWLPAVLGGNESDTLHAVWKLTRGSSVTIEDGISSEEIQDFPEKRGNAYFYAFLQFSGNSMKIYEQVAGEETLTLVETMSISVNQDNGTFIAANDMPFSFSIIGDRLTLQVEYDLDGIPVFVSMELVRVDAAILENVVIRESGSCCGCFEAEPVE